MDQLLAAFKALADETRLRLVRILLAGSFNVNELVEILGMGQSRVSRHLRILLDAGLVRTRREGTWIYYGLSDRFLERGSPGLLPGLAERLRGEGNPDEGAIVACYDQRRQRAERFFSGVARTWDAQRDRIQGPQAYLDRLVDLLEGPRTVVDLGTGTGILLSRLSALAERVIGIDPSAEMIRVARENCRERGLGNIEFRLGTLEHLPLPDAGADALIANMVLHHVAQPSGALLEVRRALRGEGRFLIADFLSHAREEYREKLGDLWLGFDFGELRSWLLEAGLRVESFERIEVDDGRPAVFLAVAAKDYST